MRKDYSGTHGYRVECPKCQTLDIYIPTKGKKIKNKIKKCRKCGYHYRMIGVNSNRVVKKLW